MKLILKLNLMKYAKDSEITQHVKSKENIIQRGTMFIRENNIFYFKICKKYLLKPKNCELVYPCPRKRADPTVPGRIYTDNCMTLYNLNCR